MPELTEASVLTPTRAARMMPGRDSDCFAWLRRNGLVLHTQLGDRVIWGDVLAQLRREGQRAEPEPPAHPVRGTLRRGSL